MRNGAPKGTISELFSVGDFVAALPQIDLASGFSV